MACEDRLTIAVRSASGRARKAFTIELDLDGKKVTCPPRVPAKGEEGSRRCSDEVTVTHQAITRCAEERVPNAVTTRCVPTGAFEDLIEVLATPKQVRVRMKQGGRLLGGKTFQPAYGPVRPNGPGCQPVCRQARQIWQTP